MLLKAWRIFFIWHQVWRVHYEFDTFCEQVCYIYFDYNILSVILDFDIKSHLNQRSRLLLQCNPWESWQKFEQSIQHTSTSWSWILDRWSWFPLEHFFIVSSWILRTKSDMQRFEFEYDSLTQRRQQWQHNKLDITFQLRML